MLSPTLTEEKSIKSDHSSGTLRKRRVSLKSTRIPRQTLSAATRQRKLQQTERKRSLYHLFSFTPNEEEEIVKKDKDNSITSDVAQSRRLSEAVLKRSTFTTIEHSTGRRRSEPYFNNMFSPLLHNKRSIKGGVKKTHGVRKFSTAEALLMKNEKKLEALAQDELLDCLNAKLKEEPASSSFDDQEIYEGTYVSEEENERRIKERKRREHKRTCIIEELLKTEQNYVSCLTLVDEVFKIPLEEKHIVTPKDLKVMFPSSLNDIQCSHARFMLELDTRLKEENWKGIIGDIFAKMTSVSENLLDIYTRYVTSFPKSISTLTKYTRGSHKFRKFLEQCYNNPQVERLDLPSFLLSPVQRLPRYILLLTELHKYTDTGHEDKDKIDTTKNEMEEIIYSLDNSIKVSMESYNSDKKKFTRHFSTRRKKTLSNLGKPEIEKKVSTHSLKDLSGSSFKRMTGSPLKKGGSRKDSNVRAPGTAQTLPRVSGNCENVHSHSPVIRRKTFNGADMGPRGMSSASKEERNSWRKSLGARLSQFFQHEECDENGTECNGIAYAGNLPFETATS